MQLLNNTIQGKIVKREFIKHVVSAKDLTDSNLTEILEIISRRGGADYTKQQAEKMVSNEFSNFDVQKVVKKMVTEDKFYGSESLKNEVRTELGKQILEKLELTIKS